MNIYWIYFKSCSSCPHRLLFNQLNNSCHVADIPVFGHVPRPHRQGLRLRLFASSTWMELFLFARWEHCSPLYFLYQNTITKLSLLFMDNEHCSSLYDRKIQERKMIKHRLTRNEKEKRVSGCKHCLLSLVNFSQNTK